MDVVTIADEVDSQLKQAMISYVTPTVVSSTVILKPRVFGECFVDIHTSTNLRKKNVISY